MGQSECKTVCVCMKERKQGREGVCVCLSVCVCVCVCVREMIVCVCAHICECVCVSHAAQNTTQIPFQHCLALFANGSVSKCVCVCVCVQCCGKLCVFSAEYYNLEQDSSCHLNR